jgi:hypothetical protein
LVEFVDEGARVSATGFTEGPLVEDVVSADEGDAAKRAGRLDPHDQVVMQAGGGLIRTGHVVSRSIKGVAGWEELAILAAGKRNGKRRRCAASVAWERADSVWNVE